MEHTKDLQIDIVKASIDKAVAFCLIPHMSFEDSRKLAEHLHKDEIGGKGRFELYVGITNKKLADWNGIIIKPRAYKEEK